MENYDDEKLLENYEAMAKAYSKALKNKGFVFIRLEEEEFSLLVDEIMVIFCKIMASLDRLKDNMYCEEMKDLTMMNINSFREKFHANCCHKFKSVQSSSDCFLTLVALENMLTLKLMILSVKSGELEFCHEIITKRTHIFANSFSIDGFILEK